MRRRLAVPFILPVCLVALAGCGGSDEEKAADMIEQMAESQGENVDVDIDDNGDMVIKTEDGELSIDADEDGGVVVQTEDGEFSSEQGQELPEDFPAEIPVLDGWVPTTSSRMGSEGEVSWFVTFATEADPKSTFAELTAAMTGAGFTTVQTMENGTDDGYTAGAGFEGAGYDMFVTVGSNTDSSSGEGSGTMVSYTVTPASAG